MKVETLASLPPPVEPTDETNKELSLLQDKKSKLEEVIQRLTSSLYKFICRFLSGNFGW